MRLGNNKFINILLKHKKLCGCFIVVFAVIISIFILIFLYNNGYIFKDDPLSAYKKSFVNIRITDTYGNSVYSEGYFMSKNKIVILYAGEMDKSKKISAFDAYNDKQYTMKKLEHFNRFSVLYTNEENDSDIQYSYFIPDIGNYLYAVISDNPIMQKYEVTDINKALGGPIYMVCDGTVLTKSGGPVIDINGRIHGICMRRKEEKDVFFVYPHIEIIKQVFLRDIKDFLNID